MAPQLLLHLPPPPCSAAGLRSTPPDARLLTPSPDLSPPTPLRPPSGKLLSEKHAAEHFDDCWGVGAPAS